MKESNPYTYISPSRESFLQADIQKEFSTLNFTYEIGFKALDLFRNSTDLNFKHIAYFIYKIASPVLRKEGKVFKYFPFSTSGENRTPIPEDLSEEELDLLNSIIDDIENPILQARMADVIWYLKHGEAKLRIQRAKQYIDIILSLDIKEENIPHYSDSIKKALSMSRSIKYRAPQIEALKSKIFDLFNSCKYDSIGIAYAMYEMIEIYPEEGDFEKIISYTDKKISEHINDFNYRSDISYLEIKEECLNKLSRNDIQNKLDISKKHEEEMLSCIETDSFINASLHCENAIKSYREIPNKERVKYKINEKLAELERKKQELGLASKENMSVFTQEITIPSEKIEEVINKITDKNFPNVLFCFISLLNGIPNLQKLKSSAEEATREVHIVDILGKSSYNSLGRVSGRTAGIDLNSSSDRERNLKEKTIELHFYNSQYLIPILLECLNTINNEHNISLENIYWLSKFSAIIPNNRRILWSKGIYAGFNKDFETSAHLLIPQIEHMVRLKLQESGIQSCVRDINGVENEKSLSTLLEELEKHTDKEIFKEDIIFELQFLFGNYPAFNMRNMIAHGIINDGDSWDKCFFVWIFALKLMIKNIAMKNPNL